MWTQFHHTDEAWISYCGEIVPLIYLVLFKMFHMIVMYILLPLITFKIFPELINCCGTSAIANPANIWMHAKVDGRGRQMPFKIPVDLFRLKY